MLPNTCLAMSAMAEFLAVCKSVKGAETPAKWPDGIRLMKPGTVKLFPMEQKSKICKKIHAIRLNDLTDLFLEIIEKDLSFFFCFGLSGSLKFIS